MSRSGGGGPGWGAAMRKAMTSSHHPSALGWPHWVYSSLWILRYPADCTPAHRDRGTPRLHANIQGPRDPCVQLCAPALVKPAAHPSEWGLGWEK